MLSASEIMLTAEQEAAMAQIDAFMADRRQVFCLAGLAGTGKTTLLQHVAGQYRHAVLCSLTGKAASVLRRRTGLKAQTLHSFFYQLIDAKKDKKGRDVLRFERAHTAGQLFGDLALLDECSMVDEGIGRDLLATGAKVIATGDPGQLPPVKGLPFFDRADFTLEQIHRQALGSPIIRQAHRVRNGGMYEPDGDAFRVQTDGTDADLREAGVVLCWTNKMRDYLNRRCRQARGHWQTFPQVGEVVVCLKNAAPFNLFNGATYVLAAPFVQGDTAITLDVDGTVMTVPRVRFRGIASDLPEDLEVTTLFDFGYAMTVHKAQGSEWESVVLVDEYRRAEQREKWLYTGITRASERILVVR